MKSRLFLMFAIAMLVLTGTTLATPSEVSLPVMIEPVDWDMKTGTIAIRIKVTAHPQCEIVQLEITELKGIEYTGDFSWQGSLTGLKQAHKRYECIIEIDVPDNDTSYIEVTARSTNFFFNNRVYFTAENGKVNFHWSLPRPRPASEKPRILTREEFLKNATEQDLAKEYEVIWFPQNEEELRILHNILQVLPKPTHKGGYIVTTTLKNHLEISRSNIKGDFVKGRPWGHLTE